MNFLARVESPACRSKLTETSLFLDVSLASWGTEMLTLRRQPQGERGFLLRQLRAAAGGSNKSR
jgi:hypothetical protein